MHAFSSRNNYSAVLSKHWQKNEDSCNLFELRHSRMDGQQCFFFFAAELFFLSDAAFTKEYLSMCFGMRQNVHANVVKSFKHRFLPPPAYSCHWLLLLCQQNNSHFLIANFLNVPYNTPYSYLLYQERYCKNQAGMRGDGHSQKYFRRFNKWQHQKRIS